MNRSEKITSNVLRLCRTAAFRSQVAYANPSVLKNLLTDTSFCQYADTFAYVQKEKDALWVVFRGTSPQSRQQAKADILCHMNPERDAGSVHLGFQNELENIWQELEEAIEPHIDLPIYITGHSLGGAMATIAAARLLRKSLKVGNPSYVPSGLITFGSPRVGDAEFASFVHGINIAQNETTRIGIWRFRNNNDFVTKMPPSFFGWRHCGKTVYIDHKQNILFDPWSLVLFLSGIRGAGYRVFRDSVADHSMSNYLETLEKHSTEDVFA